ncbi:hypothetical protein Tco_0691091 [Tanacetum coccineum]
MAEPNQTEYIFVTQKNFLSNDNEGRMVEKSFLIIQGAFLVKICDNTFKGIIGENAFEHIENFLKIVGPVKIKGVSQDRSRLSIFPVSLAGAASEWFKNYCISSVTTWEDLVEKFIQKFYQLYDNNEEMEADEDNNPDDVAEIFKIEGNLFDFETPLYKAFNEFNYLLKINTYLFTFDIKEIKTYEENELNNNMTGDLEEPWSDNGVPYQLCDSICEPYRFKNGKTKWPTCSLDIDGFCNGGELPGMVRVGYMTYFHDHKWYDELTDGVLKEETLMHKARFEKLWRDATHGVMKFCAWFKNSFENLHELDHDVLVKLKECWNYGANNAGDTRDSQEHKKEHEGNEHTLSSKPTHDLSVCHIRRFEMIKYSFDADDEYVAIKEHEHFDHSKTNIDACQAYREPFRIIDEGWLVTKAEEE